MYHVVKLFAKHLCLNREIFIALHLCQKRENHFPLKVGHQGIAYASMDYSMPMHIWVALTKHCML